MMSQYPGCRVDDRRVGMDGKNERDIRMCRHESPQDGQTLTHVVTEVLAAMRREHDTAGPCGCGEHSTDNGSSWRARQNCRYGVDNRVTGDSNGFAWHVLCEQRGAIIC